MCYTVPLLANILPTRAAAVTGIWSVPPQSRCNQVLPAGDGHLVTAPRCSTRKPASLGQGCTRDTKVHTLRWASSFWVDKEESWQGAKKPLV